MLAADNWCLKVEDKIYGPYSSSQLKKFAHEGRLAAWSLISPAGANRWREAQKEPAFASFFGGEASNDDAKTKFGRRASAQDGDQSIEKKEPSTDQVISNFILIFDVVSGAASRVETAVMNLGPSFKIADNVWTVACRHTAIGVRNSIAPLLLPRESLFIVDSTRGRSSWQNFPPEVHAKLTAAWSKAKK